MGTAMMEQKEKTNKLTKINTQRENDTKLHPKRKEEEKKTN